MEHGYLSHYRNYVKNCFLTQNVTEIGQSAAKSWPKNLFKRRPFAILNFKKVHIWSSGCHWVPNVLLCTKFHQNRMIFRWDMVSSWLTRSAILNFREWIRGSLKSPRGTSCRSSINPIALNCWFFQKKAVASGALIIHCGQKSVTVSQFTVVSINVNQFL